MKDDPARDSSSQQQQHLGQSEVDSWEERCAECGELSNAQ